MREPISVTMSQEWVLSFSRLIAYLHRAQGGGDYSDTPRSVEHDCPDGFKVVYYVLSRLQRDLFSFPCETTITGKDARTLQEALTDMRRILHAELVRAAWSSASSWWRENEEDEDAPRMALNLLRRKLLSRDPEDNAGV